MKLQTVLKHLRTIRETRCNRQVHRKALAIVIEKIEWQLANQKKPIK